MPMRMPKALKNLSCLKRTSSKRQDSKRKLRQLFSKKATLQITHPSKVPDTNTDGDQLVVQKQKSQFMKSVCAPVSTAIQPIVKKASGVAGKLKRSFSAPPNIGWLKSKFDKGSVKVGEYQHKVDDLVKALVLERLGKTKRKKKKKKRQVKTGTEIGLFGTDIEVLDYKSTEDVPEAEEIVKGDTQVPSYPFEEFETPAEPQPNDAPVVEVTEDKLVLEASMVEESQPDTEPITNESPQHEEEVAVIPASDSTETASTSKQTSDRELSESEQSTGMTMSKDTVEPVKEVIEVVESSSESQTSLTTETTLSTVSEVIEVTSEIPIVEEAELQEAKPLTVIQSPETGAEIKPSISKSISEVESTTVAQPTKAEITPEIAKDPEVEEENVQVKPRISKNISQVDLTKVAQSTKAEITPKIAKDPEVEEENVLVKPRISKNISQVDLTKVAQSTKATITPKIVKEEEKIVVLAEPIKPGAVSGDEKSLCASWAAKEAAMVDKIVSTLGAVMANVYRNDEKKVSPLEMSTLKSPSIHDSLAVPKPKGPIEIRIYQQTNIKQSPVRRPKTVVTQPSLNKRTKKDETRKHSANAFLKFLKDNGKVKTGKNFTPKSQRASIGYPKSDFPKGSTSMDSMTDSHRAKGSSSHFDPGSLRPSCCQCRKSHYDIRHCHHSKRAGCGFQRSALTNRWEREHYPLYPCHKRMCHPPLGGNLGRNTLEGSTVDTITDLVAWDLANAMMRQSNQRDGSLKWLSSGEPSDRSNRSVSMMRALMSQLAPNGF